MRYETWTRELDRKSTRTWKRVATQGTSHRTLHVASLACPAVLSFFERPDRTRTPIPESLHWPIEEQIKAHSGQLYKSRIYRSTARMAALSKRICLVFKCAEPRNHTWTGTANDTAEKSGLWSGLAQLTLFFFLFLFFFPFRLMLSRI